MSQELETALNEGVERASTGMTAEEAVRWTDSQHADELAPLVELAQEIRSLPRPTPPARGLADVQDQVRRAARARREAEHAKSRPTPRLPVPARLVWRLVQVTAVVLVALALSMGSVTVAAESLPGSPLYPVKRAAEQVQLRITFNPQQRAALRLTFAERRANEMVALAHRGRPIDQVTLAVMLDETGIAIRRLQDLSPEAARTLLTRAQKILEYQQICLVHIRLDAPKAALATIDQAIRICEHRAQLIQQMQTELLSNMPSR